MFERLLVPTDGSNHALRAAEYAADMAVKYKSRVTLLYVAELPPVIGIRPSEERLRDMRQDLGAQGREALRKTAEVFSRNGVHPQEELIFGSAVPDILQHAHDGQHDLIVIGSRGAGTGAIEQILIGSVAEGILHGAPCPVLMARPC